eukprot:scaffold149521_cov17-Prasinocladus_malaysianus.AAC.1
MMHASHLLVQPVETLNSIDELVLGGNDPHACMIIARVHMIWPTWHQAENVTLNYKPPLDGDQCTLRKKTSRHGPASSKMR